MANDPTAEHVVTVDADGHMLVGVASPTRGNDALLGTTRAVGFDADGALPERRDGETAAMSTQSATPDFGGYVAFTGSS
jgi:hypothetical protein